MTSTQAFLYASLLFHIAVAMPGAMPWIGPVPTAMGLMATAGMSPKPTSAPGLNGIPKELRRRQNVQYPPPDSWCGFVNGVYDTDSILSCSTGLTCVNSGSALGCCTATTGICTALYTTCLNFGDICDTECELDNRILSCDAVSAFCGTYAFPGDTALFDCQTAAMPIAAVEFLSDYYVTAIGSTLAPSNSPFPFSASASVAGSSAVPTSSFPTSEPEPQHTGLVQGAIDGIAAAVAIVGFLILATIVFFCLRARKRRRIAASQRPTAYSSAPTPMQQQQQQQQQYPPPKTFDGYQSVPQQEQQPQYTQYSPQPQQEQKPPYTQYPSQPQQNQTGYVSPPGAASAVSPQATGTTDPRRYSSANISLLSPQSPQPDQRQNYYKPPLSPTITEVDGTMGSPGVPTSLMQGQGHSPATEVDGTMGNPGVPSGGHGIQSPMTPGGTPSATEIDGISRQGGSVQQGPVMQQGSISNGPSMQHGASPNGPYLEGPYEMGNERH